MNSEKLKGFRATDRAQLEVDGIHFYSGLNELMSVTFFGNAWQMESRSRKNIPGRCIRLGN